MRLKSHLCQFLACTLATASIAMTAQPSHAAPPMIKNSGADKLWVMPWDNTPPSGRFDSMVVRIAPAGDDNTFWTRVWLYKSTAHPTIPGKFVLQLEETYHFQSDFLRPGRANKRSNLVANPKYKPARPEAKGESENQVNNADGEKETDDQGTRYFALTGTQNPGGPQGPPPTPPIRRMLRVTTLRIIPRTDAALRRATDCEEYPDDEMLYEDDYQYDESQDNPDDPEYNDQYDPYTVG